MKVQKLKIVTKKKYGRTVYKKKQSSLVKVVFALIGLFALFVASLVAILF